MHSGSGWYQSREKINDSSDDSLPWRSKNILPYTTGGEGVKIPTLLQRRGETKCYKGQRSERRRIKHANVTWINQDSAGATEANGKREECRLYLGQTGDVS